MRIVEEPLVTRESVVATLRFGEPSTEAPFRTLRRNRHASPGVSIPLRSPLGRLSGSLNLYSALNVDAARAVRRNRPEAAAALADRAADLESSAAAREVVEAIRGAAATLSMGPEVGKTSQAVAAYRRYRAMRRRADWLGLENDPIDSGWLVNPASWLASRLDDDSLVAAVEQLGIDTAAARAQEFETLGPSVTTFLGTVRRLDAVAADIRADTGLGLLLSRRDLEREGLAVLGQAVSVVREELPNGRVVSFVAPAAALDSPARSAEYDPFARTESATLGPDDAAWLDRVLASEPRTILGTPLAIGVAT